ncbi:hypothetical protein [Paenibacillus sp. 481]|uniref:hypothetical protein n=1 Tax=Paenibacillus sp. 481 TaxID=2835869 RepID=UPI001E4F7DAD|nr:hypothetical protein [Paenibacillus sp. 481]UHA73833.1 hypothetical protein KIK04_01280 [Paenibacillus sp. 481]
MPHQNISQQLFQCEQVIQQLIQQTQQASQQYEQLLIQEQQNAAYLEQIAQREHHAAHVIQTALQGHSKALQQMQHVSQVCHQIEQFVQSQAQTQVHQVNTHHYQPHQHVAYADQARTTF